MSASARKRVLVLVLGATGRFGGIVDLLLQRGHHVRAATRDPGQPLPPHLTARGVEVIPADYEDVDSLEAAARGVDAVFASGTAHRAGPDAEARHGHNLARALAAAGGPQLIFVSGAGAERSTGVPVLEAKRMVEERIRELALPATVLAPVYLMENLFNPWNLAAIRAGRLPTPVPAWRRLQQVSIADIVALAALVIEQPGGLVGERIEIAADEPTGDQAAAVLAEILGASLLAEQLPRAGLPPGLVALFEWLERDPLAVDISALRQRFPQVRWRRFDDWAREQKPQLANAFADTPDRVG